MCVSVITLLHTYKLPIKTKGLPVRHRAALLVQLGTKECWIIKSLVLSVLAIVSIGYDTVVLTKFVAEFWEHSNITAKQGVNKPTA